MSEQQRHELHELTREESFALLRGRPLLGRIGYVVDGVPVIVPVNFVVDGETVAFCTAEGSKLSWLSNHSHIAFQVDERHEPDQSGWSVLIRGTAGQVTDPGELSALRRGPRSWAVPSTEHWVRISADQVTGRWLGTRPVA